MAKRICQRAEWKWRKNKLQADVEIYKNTLYCHNKEMKSAGQSYICHLINSNWNNPLFLFSSIDKLINPSNLLPPELLSKAKCDEFAVLYQEKVSNLRDNILLFHSNTSKDSCLQNLTTVISMSTFSPITSNSLEGNISTSKILHLFSLSYPH